MVGFYGSAALSFVFALCAEQDERLKSVLRGARGIYAQDLERFRLSFVPIMPDAI